jgi:predicted enzyme related to lactoylglutathione lyase
LEGTVEKHKGLLSWPTWIGVVVDDLEAQRRFWSEMLGVPEDHAGPGFAHFIMPTGEIFEVIERSEIPEYNGRRFQVGFEVVDIEATRAELTRRGITPISEIMGVDSSDPWAYFLDLEGNVFEIKQRKRTG